MSRNCKASSALSSVALLLLCLTGCGATDEEVDPAPFVESGVPAAGPMGEMAGQSIQNLAGCFAVTYRFVEDGEHDFLQEGSVEYIDVRSDGGGGYTLRHFQVTKELTFHHFTEQWAPVGGGVYRQTVTGADGALRYEGEGAWVFNQWEGSAAGAAKPVRDKDRPYATLDRRNTVQVTKGGWIHAQRNLKRMADGTPVASEVGWVDYTRTSEEPCGAALELSESMK